MGTSVRPFVNYNDENKGVSSTLFRTESILNINILYLISESKNIGCQSICDKKDHCPRNARYSITNCQCFSTKICSVIGCRKPSFLSSDVELNHSLNSPTGK